MPHSKSRTIHVICKTILISTVLFLYISPKAFTQMQLSIKSASDSSNLSYATIFNLTTKRVHSANENGIFTTSENVNNSFRISYTGFEDTIFTPNTKKSIQTIYLTRKTVQLKEVIIQTCRETIEEKVCNFKPPHKTKKFGGMMCGKDDNNLKLAVYINATNKKSTLSTIHFWLSNSYSKPKYSIESPLAISFYSTSDSTNLPNELLYDKPIIYYPKKQGKQTINVDSLHIEVPDKGIFVCIEFIMDEKYQWNMKFKNSTRVFQGGVLDSFLSNDEAIAWFDYRSNRWFHLQYGATFSPDGFRTNIKLEAIFKHCKN